MGIIIDARAHGTDFSGIARYAHMLLLGIAQAKPDKKITVLIKEKSTLHSTLASSSVFDWVELPRQPYGVYQQFRLPRLLRRLDAKCLHSIDVHSPLVTSCRKIITIHDVIPLVFPNRSGIKSRYRRLWRTWLRWQVHNAAALVTVSEWSKRDIQRELKASPDSITVIPPAVEIPKDNATPPNILRGRFQLSGRIILAVGRRDPHKNLVGLIESFGILTKLLDEPLHLVIVGGFDDRFPEPEQTVAKLGLESKVLFTGPLPDEDLVGFYQLSSLLAFPSLYEGYGLPVLEAMHMCLPVVSSNRTSLPEVLGDAGLLVDPADTAQMARAMADILCNPILAETLRQRGLKQAAHLSLKGQAEKYLHLYQQVLLAH